VLTESDYFARLAFDGPLDVRFRADAMSRTLLFIGYSMQDLNIRLLLYRIWETWNRSAYERNRRVATCSCPRANPAQEAVLGSWGITVLTSREEEPEAALTGFLERLAARVGDSARKRPKGTDSPRLHRCGRGGATLPHAMDGTPQNPQDPTDPYEREAQIFPRLLEAMARRVAGYGREETVPDGTLLFERGQKSVDFFLVLSGEVEIFDTDEEDRPNVFTVHGERQFTGELDLFNDRDILVSGRARGETRVVRVPRGDFRRLVMAEPDIGEIIMRAFILRRTGLIQHEQGAVSLVGPGMTATRCASGSS
jgi:hypothetical protein